MNEKELMVGDWVQTQRFMYGQSCVDVNIQVYAEMITDIQFGYDCASPIPLTEEILKANGWWSDPEMDTDNEKNVFCRYGDYAITYTSYNGLPVLTIEQDNLMKHRTCVVLVDEVYNVHELQHALRLCGLTELADNFKIN